MCFAKSDGWKYEFGLAGCVKWNRPKHDGPNANRQVSNDLFYLAQDAARISGIRSGTYSKCSEADILANKQEAISASDVVEIDLAISDL